MIHNKHACLRNITLVNNALNEANVLHLWLEEDELEEEWEDLTEEWTEEEWDDVLTTNLRGMVLTCQTILPGMVDAGWGR